MNMGNLRMRKIFIQILILFLIVSSGCTYQNRIDDDAPPSFRNGVKAFMDKRSGSKIDEKDKSIMVKASSDLEISMPDPGLKAGEIAPGFSLINAFGKKLKLSEALLCHYDAEARGQSGIVATDAWPRIV